MASHPYISQCNISTITYHSTRLNNTNTYYTLKQENHLYFQTCKILPETTTYTHKEILNHKHTGTLIICTKNQKTQDNIHSWTFIVENRVFPLPNRFLTNVITLTTYKKTYVKTPKISILKVVLFQIIYSF